ncbi:MAG TPA: chorismate-binding protein [Acidimicrobiales bacterium]|nr:chorismate-binding protein [Acidimicrobiales bacterium]
MAEAAALPLTPGPEEFAALARAHRVVPVAVHLVADTITPVAAFGRLCRGEPGFLLESVEHGERWGRWSFVGRRPAATVVSHHGRVELRPTADGRPGVAPPPGTTAVDAGGGVLAALEELLGAYRSPAVEGLPPLHGGLVGYLGYDVIREVEHLPAVPPDDQDLPEAILSLVGELAAFDHWRQRVTLVANVFVPDDADDAWLAAAYATAAARLAALAADGATAVDEPLVAPPSPDDPLPEVTPTVPPEAFAAAVEVAKEHILAGDVFQVVLSQRFDLDLDADPFDLYRVLRQVNPSPCMYLVRHDEVTLVGSSPEPLVQLRDGRVISRPIAGTRYRGRTEEEDRRLAAELVEHPKEVAEHVMLVDLARNDVGRVVRFGTCRVEEMMTLERYSHVMHLTSQVAGELAEGLTPIDVLRATLPAGTLTGAPKVRAMEIIDELEPTKRGPYGGVVGYVDLSGVIDTAITIRTMVCLPDGRASIQAGAGIVADSVPEHEELECRNKARALLAAVPAARRMTAASRAAAPT